MKMPHWPKPIGLLQNETSLTRMQDILVRLGEPHLKLPPVIHIAGTNGKGSTLAFLQAMLEAAGKKVHKYITPHLVDFNERITLGGRLITDDELFEVMEEVRINSEDIRLGFYEATTAGALLAFSRQRADYLLLETGLGGRLDATNIIPAPLLAILSTIDKDHMDYLGSDVRQIAGEKVWIVKEGSSCISALQHDEVADVIEKWCAARGVPYASFGYDFGIEKTENGFKYISGHGELEMPMPALAGDHQYINAATAITAALALELGGAEIAEGVKSAKWPSRLERIEKPFVPEGFEFWLDGAHNAAGAFAIAGHVRENWADMPVYIIYGTTRGRNVAEFLQYFDTWPVMLTKITAEPNSYESEEMQAQLSKKHEHFGSIKEAVKHIANLPKGRILCLGSLFMRGDVI